MGINATNTQSYYLEALKNQQPQNNFRLANSYVNTPMFNNNVQQPAVDSFNNKTLTTADGKDDGSIGFVKAAGNLFKGVGNFFKGMVCDENGKFSITRTLTTIGIGAAIGVACAFLPTIAVAGMTFSTLGLISAGFGAIAAYHVGDAAIDIMSAKTDAEAEQGWQNLGSGLTEGGLAYLGYRASGGIMAKDTVAPTPSGSTPKTPKTPKAPTEEAPVEPTRTSVPKAETLVEEPVVETLKTESVAEKPVVESVVEEPVVLTAKPESIVEKPAMTMTDEARAQYNQTKSLLENTKHRVSADAIDEQFATPKELAELKEYYTELEKTVVDAPKTEPAIKAPVAATSKTKTVAETIEAKAETNVDEVSIIYDNIFADIKGNIIKFSDETHITNHHRIEGENALYRDLIDAIEKNDLDSFNESWNEFGLRDINGLIKAINKTDSRFQELPPTECDVVSYRGVTDSPILNNKYTYMDKHKWFENMSKVKEGDIVCPDKAYSYTAMQEDLASVYGYGGKRYTDRRAMSMIIKIPRGAKVSRLEEGHGAEILMPRNAKYKVVGKEVDCNGNIRLYLEYILPTEPLKPLSI